MAVHLVQGVPEGSPLSGGQLAEIEAAEKRGKKIRRARTVAVCDAWITAGFAALTLVTGMLDVTSIVLGLAMGGIAWNSFRGARYLKRMDMRGPKLLGKNQLVLMGILILYAAYSLWGASRGGGELMSVLNSEPSLGDMRNLFWMLNVMVYGGLIVGTVVGQGLTAWYYFSRGKYVAAYLKETPGWVVELEKRRG